MKLIPLHENVIVMPLVGDEKVGSVFLAVQKAKNEGEVIAVAEDVIYVKKGDIVGFQNYAGTLVESTDPKENRIVMDVHDILYVRT